MLKKTLTILTIASLLFAMATCQKNIPSPQSQTVLVSVSPYIYFVRKIAGPELIVYSLVPEDSNPHIYEPKPQQVQALGHAQLWLRLGDPADKKANDVFKEQNPEMIIVDLTEGIQLLSSCEEAHLNHQCRDEGADLHIWMSPRLAQKQAKAIAKGLIEAFPENRQRYEAGLKDFLIELGQLDREISAQLAPKKADAILVSHPAFAYFCQDYDLIQLSIEAEGKDPLPQHITELMEQTKNFHITVVLLQPQYSNKGAELIAERLHLATAIVNPYAEDYVDNLRRLAQIIAIPNVFQNAVSGNAGASDLQLPKQSMCKHMADGGGCKDGDAGAARNRILKHVRYPPDSVNIPAVSP